MAGRLPTLTAEIADAFAARMRGGVTFRMAADALGIPVQTAQEWRRLGNTARECEIADCTDRHHGPVRGEVSFADFSQQVQMAKGNVAARAVLSIINAFQRDPKLAMAYLSSQYPEEIGPRARMRSDSEPERERTPFDITYIEVNRPPGEMDELTGHLTSPDGPAASDTAISPAPDPRSSAPDADEAEPRAR